jgi:hypothetical protein
MSEQEWEKWNYPKNLKWIESLRGSKYTHSRGFPTGASQAE